MKELNICARKSVVNDVGSVLNDDFGLVIKELLIIFGWRKSAMNMLGADFGLFWEWINWWKSNFCIEGVVEVRKWRLVRIARCVHQVFDEISD